METFYQELRDVLVAGGFDATVVALSANGGAALEKLRLPRYFRALLVGYLEGIVTLRALEWRCDDSRAVRGFLGLRADEPAPTCSELAGVRAEVSEGLHRAVLGEALSLMDSAGLYAQPELASSGAPVVYVDTLFGDRRRSDGTDRTWERLGAATEAWGLTPSQSRVLARVAQGESNKEIATRLQCAENTVEAHLTALLRKSRAPGRVALAVAFWTLEA